ISLWRLANLAERQGKLSEAIALLEKGLPVVEAVRARTYGDAQQRAAFFAQFAPAFEQLVERDVKAGRLEAAVLHAARTRSRTLLGADQPEKLLAGLRDRVLGPRTALLGYYFGEGSAYLLLLGDRSRQPEVYPLTVSPKLLASLAALKAPARRDMDGGRGIVV